MQYTAIIGAMDIEVEGLRERLDGAQPISTGQLGFPLCAGVLGRTPVLLAKCGIGKVNAALCTQYLIDHFPVRALINSGVAGALGPQVNPGDLVVSHAALHHDVDVSFFGYPKGVVPGLNVGRFPADQKLVQCAVGEARRVLDKDRVHQGLIVSGDRFVAEGRDKQAILENFPDALCVEMEGSAIAQVAYQNKVPFVILRAMSDHADDSARADYETYLKRTIPVLNEIVTGMVAKL
ncbi:MAG: 5'-methylthioadenosine/adenosylhomocysteine nucleosidase [Firmicutes bacterium]|jgi:adenosylhomocysteine nucleosidase|nr:5'-methylthioadenosine/adenosylhomocysteine nucleosidase [Bacillota bacterium]